MLDNQSKFIDVICYIIIFLLLLLIVLPPLLRFVMPGGNKYETKLYLESLRCSISNGEKEKIVNTQYKNKEVTKVYITYNNYTDEQELEEKALLGINGVSEDIEGTRTLYTIEYNDETKNNLDLEKYFGKIDELKSLYENGSYTCNVITN